MVLASFGSVVAGERYEALLEGAKKRFPEADIFLSFSSRMVLKKLKEEGNPIESLPEILARLDREGYRRIVVSSINLYPTDEHELLVRTVEGFKHFSPAALRSTHAIFTRTRVTGEILESISKELHEKEPARLYLYVAHGSPYLDQGGLGAYSYSREFLRALSKKNYLCSLEGTFPCHSMMDEIGEILEDRSPGNPASQEKPGLVIIPLLLVSGRHFQDDISELTERLSQVAEVRVAPSISKDLPFHLLERDEIKEAIFKEIEQEIAKFP